MGITWVTLGIVVGQVNPPHKSSPKIWSEWGFDFDIPTIVPYGTHNWVGD